MARALRLHVPGVAVHLLSRGNNKQCIFTDTEDYRQYLRLLSGVLERFAVKCHAFCLMWNHTHLIATPSEFPLSGMMQQLNSHYCQWFNRRHGRVGHVLQGRYRGLLIDEASYFLNAIRYVVLNPVSAGIVTEPAAWPWSSYRASAGLEAAPPCLDLERVWRSLDAEDDEDRQQRFIAFVQREHAEDPRGPLFFGPERFGRKIDPLLEPHRHVQEFLYAQRFATRPSLESLLVGAHYGTELEDAVRGAFFDHAYTLKQIGTALRVHTSTIWVWARRSQYRRSI